MLAAFDPVGTENNTRTLSDPVGAFKRVDAVIAILAIAIYPVAVFSAITFPVYVFPSRARAFRSHS